MTRHAAFLCKGKAAQHVADTTAVGQRQCPRFTGQNPARRRNHLLSKKAATFLENEGRYFRRAGNLVDTLREQPRGISRVDWLMRLKPPPRSSPPRRQRCI